MASVCIQPPIVYQQQPGVHRVLEGCIGEPPPLTPISSKGVFARRHAAISGSKSTLKCTSPDGQPPFTASARGSLPRTNTAHISTMTPAFQGPPKSHAVSSASTDLFIPVQMTTTPNDIVTARNKAPSSNRPRLVAKDLAVQPRANQIMAAYQSHMERRTRERRRLLQMQLIQAQRQSIARKRNHMRATTMTATSPMTVQGAHASRMSSPTSPPVAGQLPPQASSMPGNHFSHLFSQQDINDGFNPERAHSLQSMVSEDPSARRLPDGKVVYGCSQCEVSFVWRRHLERHFEEHRSASKTMLCRLCGKCFTRPDHLNRHCSTAHSCSDIPCQLCGEMFSKASHLDRHWEATHKASNFLPEGSPSNIQLSPNGSSSSTTGNQSEPPPAKPVFCFPVTGLPVSYITGGKLLPTSLGYQPQRTNPATTSVYTVQTIPSTHVSMQQTTAKASSPVSTGSTFGSQAPAPSHMDPFACDQCGRTFPRRSFLKAHISTVHSTGQEEMDSSDDSMPPNLPPLIAAHDPGQQNQYEGQSEEDDEDEEINVVDLDDGDACSYQVECSDTEWIESPEPMMTDGDLIIDESADTYGNDEDDEVEVEDDI